MKINYRRPTTAGKTMVFLLIAILLTTTNFAFGFRLPITDSSIITKINQQFLPPSVGNDIFNEYAANNVAIPAVCPGAGLLISEILSNPSGSDSPFEFVELRATRAIDFSVTPYSVVFTNNGTATASGWIAGGTLSYGFSITTGTVNVGDIVYVGGSSMTPTGTKLRTINTATTAGDGFGNAAASGVLGNGGTSADAVAVFDLGIGSLTNATVPIDAIFFGTGTGNAVVSGGAAGYQLPVNDRYIGGKLQSTSFLAPDPGGLYLTATGTFNLADCTFSTARTWTAVNLSNGTTSVELTAPAGTPTVSENTATPFLNLPATNSGVVSGVIGDPTDPAQTLGVDFTFADSNTPPESLVITATSSNQAVVPNANLNLTGSGLTRNLKITPAGVGFAIINITVSDGGTSSGYAINYAASAASATPATTVFHTGKADASTAIAVDANYMFVADDEDQALRLYDRNKSGLPLASFDFTASLGLTEIDNGTPREVDIEASAQIGSRIYWLASHSNSSTGVLRPNRSRLFATDISGAGAASTLTYVGRYDGLRTDLINWDVNNTHGLGANFFGLQASAMAGVIPEDPTGGGFNIEGLTIAPDGTTAYVAFRAPIVPPGSRTLALIVPVTNFASLVAANPSAGPAMFGAPIQLDLGGRGIREIKKNSSNQYLIVAGTAGGPANFQLYTWTGMPGSTAVLRNTNLTGLNPESIVEVPANLNAANPVQLLSDNGDDVFYGNGVLAKDLPSNEFKKFRSDIVNILLAPTAASINVRGRVLNSMRRSVPRAEIRMINIATGEIKTARSNSSGYFNFTNVAAGATYLFEVRHKQLYFQPQVLTINEDLTDLNIYSQSLF